jgi:hypothetical protein
MSRILGARRSSHRELHLDRPLGRAVHVEHDAQIDDVQHLQAQVAQIVVDCLGQFFGRESRLPRSILARLAPILVTMTRSSRYGANASRMSRLVTCGP